MQGRGTGGKPRSIEVMNANTHLLSIDVGSLELVTAVRLGSERIKSVAFANEHAGHLQLVSHARQSGPSGATIRVGLEATGTYSLEIALLLSRTPGFEVSVINPKTIKNFLRAQGLRSKTDKIDAAGILRYLEVMPFRPWTAPAANILALQSIGRRLYQLNAERTRERNRLHAIEVNDTAGPAVLADLRLAIEQLEERRRTLKRAALEIIKADPHLWQKYQLLTSIKGVADTTAVHLLGELLVLDPSMKGPQLVAHAGLDPRVRQSGTSLDGHRYISKAGNRYIRAALYMPAMVATRREPAFAAKYRHLVDQGRKPKMIALVAIMRKMLLCIHGMLRSNTPFDPTKLHPQLALADHSVKNTT
jgi:transposase